MRSKPDVPLLKAPVPRAHRSGPRRRAIQQSSALLAGEALGRIEPGVEAFVLTDGRFSLIDVLAHALDATGPAEINIACWTANDLDLVKAHAFVLDGRVKRARFLVDPSFRARQPGFCAVLIDLFGDQAVRTLPIHAKFATVRNEAWTLAIRTSMNLNANRRIETVEISDDPGLCGFLKSFVDEVFEVHGEGANFTSQRRSLLDRPDTSGPKLSIGSGGKLVF